MSTSRHMNTTQRIKARLRGLIWPFMARLPRPLVKALDRKGQELDVSRNRLLQLAAVLVLRTDNAELSDMLKNLPFYMAAYGTKDNNAQPSKNGTQET